MGKWRQSYEGSALLTGEAEKGRALQAEVTRGASRKVSPMDPHHQTQEDQNEISDHHRTR